MSGTLVESSSVIQKKRVKAGGSALIVMRGIQSIVRTGRTVLCTIHQPSIVIFDFFDGLLLLQRG
ncbi:uncharacterized protein CCR75_009633 [Bremia lactucae]|uniref:ABC transporter family G domain-containing protein n=1 Tax=Bremia lactucae TaxID=4779 RepID=A0A976NYW1_BRELC|nr:hypothetical protein CCR75_009633 [Bremia lactucae]